MANHLMKAPGLDAVTSRPRLPERGDVASHGTGFQAGFTLLELMAVLALMTLLMGLVLPSLLSSWEREKNRAALRGLATALRTARSEAVTTR